ncbi:hypothetical protein FBUS_03911 [Fasciolopsis buskii]|uniref:G-protein coupled receptors family 1 profile domain-containing protein n=1 Tax=Fasciolopsis buskii TaxID=27845 RepID=A0A8E0RRA3_9TREM|nr:hypothetical protein FBUS_03911 [Fasciolopsis buski]
MNVARFEKLPPTYLLFTECKSSWNREVLLPLKYIEMVVLFFLPFSWMGVAYIWIVRELWCVRRRQMTTKTTILPPLNHLHTPSHPRLQLVIRERENLEQHDSHEPVQNICGETCRHIIHHPAVTLDSAATSEAPQTSQNGDQNLAIAPPSASQMRKRRRAALMLILIVAIFFISYLPVHVIEIIRLRKCKSFVEILTCKKGEHLGTRLIIGDKSAVHWAVENLKINLSPPSMFHRNTYDQNVFDQYPMMARAMNAMAKCLHLLCFINSAINPIIYNFMSSKLNLL